MPDDSVGRSLEMCDSLKVPGRLKICSRSLIFEPSNHNKPLVKYSFKSIGTDGVTEYVLPSRQKHLYSALNVSGFLTFRCRKIFEMMQNERVSPYRQLTFGGTESENEGVHILFSLAHADLSAVLRKIDELRQISTKGSTLGRNALNAFVSASTQAGISFDMSELVDFHEVLTLDSAVPVRKVSPLVLNPGHLMITSKRVYFQPGSINNVSMKLQNFELDAVKRVYRRRYLLQQTGLEFILGDGRSYLFTFEDERMRDRIHAIILSQAHRCQSSEAMDEVVKRWQRREISNFDYLMYLNREAGRSLNDLTQYPVFPHVIADYVSDSLDLNDPKSFRDLSQPMGALNPQRLCAFRERYESMPPGDEAAGIPPPFLYGTHYSSPGYVLYYLVRVAPEYMLCLQNGKFDAPDRMFISCPETWRSCLHNPTDLKVYSTLTSPPIIGDYRVFTI
jgi:factor associated with neutral sphingomyelinase activation